MEEESREIIERAIDLGINFFDTANMYSRGESERILGNTLTDYDRDEQVLATKVYHPMRKDDPNSGGLSRKTIEQELANSLDRLGMDTIDLYQIHRWDDETPIETTMRALDDAVRRNQVRYIGASSMWTHQFADARYTSDRLDLERFVTMQNHYNLLYREEEREMLPFCDKMNIGVLPWSSLARGYLTRPHEEINERVAEIAAQEGATMAQIALAWLLHKEEVTAPIVGTTSVKHLEEAVAALDISLSDSDVAYLEEPYHPLPVSGHQ